MLRDKHKRKIKHVVLVTSNATDAGIRQFHIGSGGLWVIVVALCIIIGALLGYIAYEERIWQAVMDRSDVQQEKIRELEEANALLTTENLSLGTEIDGLNETVQILSETVSLKTQSESELMEKLEQQSMPVRLPLNGSAAMEESDEGQPICVFTASVGVTVVAAANGTVTAVNDDVEYGHNVWIDHGNGYVTIYRNGGEPQVKLGESVVGGTTLFVIEKDHGKLGYHMMKDGEYISPTEMLDISG
ncbi:MAG: M23 family metallopeptidase [Acetatifactor muris]|nr:M23 family metallopeptidase [Acetatifactor muris]MCM1527420.1 M23 family metallopeptidase [Bacteroides sp.]